MNCRIHPDTPSVVACCQCETGMCADCVDNGITYEKKPVCAVCAPGFLADSVTAAKKERMWAVICLAVGCVLMGVGVISALSGFVAGKPDKVANAVIAIIFFFGLAGLPSMLRNRSGFSFVSTSIGVMAVYFLTRLVLSFVFGAVIAPVNAVRNALTIKQTSSAIANCEALALAYQ